MLVDTNTGGVDRDEVTIISGRDRVQDAVPHARPASAHEPILAGGGGPIPLGDVAPGRADAEAPENAVEHPAVVHPRNAARLVG